MSSLQFQVKEDSSSPDVIKIDVPLFIRILELILEDTKDDAELHEVATRVIAQSKKTDVLTMKDYDAIKKKGIPVVKESSAQKIAAVAETYKAMTSFQTSK